MRVLEYRDLPGGKTLPHQHPDSVMYTLSAFQRRLHVGQGTRDVVMEPGRAYWLPAQAHAGENTGTTPTHVLFVELKDAEATRPVHRGGGHGGDAGRPGLSSGLPDASPHRSAPMPFSKPGLLR